MAGIYSIGLSALQAAQTGVLTTGHNIANVNTPGYTRQEVIQSARLPQFFGGVFTGKGTEVTEIRRIYSESLTQQLSSARSQSSEADAYLKRATSLENLFANAQAGLQPALDGFQNGLSQLSTNPADPVLRQGALSSASTLAERFNLIAARLADVRLETVRDIQNSATEVNALASSLAQMNKQIEIAGGAAPPVQLPNDLLDQRDQIINRLNDFIGATAVRNPDGTANVYIGSGEPLVIAGTAYSLAPVTDSQNGALMQLALQVGSTQMRIPNDLVRGGRISADLQFLDKSLTPVENAVGRVAIGIAEVYNAQHHAGVDLNGALGGDLFRYGLPIASPAPGNSGTAAISVSVRSVAALHPSDYRLDYNGSQYTATRLADGVVQNFASLPQTIDGIELTITGGAVAAGDSYLVQPYRSAAASLGVALVDPDRIAAALPVKAQTGLANLGNVGTRDLAVSPAGAQNANLLSGVTITFTSPTSFNVTGAGTGNPTGLAYTAGMSVSFNGWSTRLDGNAVAGDTVQISANSQGGADNGNVRALIDAGRSGWFDNGTTSFTAAHSQMLGAVGAKTHELKIVQAANESLLAQSKEARESLSGVNLDEEAANLLRYQQAYQAASKLITIAGSLFDELLSTLGR